MNIKTFIYFTFFGFLSLIPPSLSWAQAYDYVILPGDVLHVSVWKEDTMNQEVVVLPDGTITFPLTGTIQVKNMTPQQLQADIRSRLQTYIPDAAVTVSVKAPLGHKASIIGQVKTPGEIILTNRMDVMSALSQAGGLTPYADEGDIIIIRTSDKGEKRKIAFPYNAIAKGKKLDQNIDLIPGDVIVVPTAGLF